MSNVLHLLPTSSAAGSASVAFPDDDIGHIHDAFTEGPVPPLESSPTLRDWLTRRLDYWCGLPGTVHRHGVDTDEVVDTFCNTLSRFNDYDEVVLWVSDGLGDSLFLCWAVAAASAEGFDLSLLRIASPHVENSRGMWTYLGACAPENFQDGTWRSWTSSELDAARKAWRAFTACSPEPLLDLIAEPTDIAFLTPLPHLLGRYPAVESGLDRWEQRLLERLVDHLEVTAYTIGNVLADGWEETPDHIGDESLFHRLLELSVPHAPQALLRRWGSGSSMRTTYFALTELGESVLEGEANRIHVLGLDRWVGGVHLAPSNGEVWCRDGSTLRLASFPNAPSPAASPTLSPMTAPDGYPTDEAHLVVGRGFRALSPVVPDKRVWALPPLPAVQQGSIRKLTDWMREGGRAFADDAIEEMPNVARADEDLDGFEACLSTARPIHIWVGRSVHERLLAGGVACKVRSLRRDPGEVVRLCEVDESATGRGVGDIHPLFLERTECHEADAVVGGLVAVWEAFVAPTPTALNELLDTESLTPEIDRILDHLLDLFPDKTSGLTHIEEQALRRIEKNDRRTFYETADVAQALADPNLDQPLLSRTDVETRCIPSAFEFTNFGRRVLAGEANHIRANGIDQWIGGIHLSSADGQVWWRDDRRLV